MATQICTVCAGDFDVRFSYQMEERVERDPVGRPRARFVFYCSQECVTRSHQGGDSGVVACDACRASFRVELAGQVVFVHGQRTYACSAECRRQILAESRGARLGEGWDTAAVPLDEVGDLPPVLDPQRGAHLATVAALRTGVERAPAVLRSVPSPPERRTDSPPKVIAVFNHKGGTGKTTTSVTIAAGLALRGRRVLLVDTDAQGNVAHSLNVRVERSLYHVLVMGISIASAALTVRPNLDVLPSNESLAAAELYLAGRQNRDRVLAQRLALATTLYDHVVLDCSPSLSLMNQNALAFADGVLCPVACDYLSLVGVRQVLKTLKNVNRLLGHPVRLWGVLPTMFDPRARICHEALDTLKEHFGDRCFEPIRQATRVREAPATGQSLFEYAPGSRSTRDYERVVNRLLSDQEVGALDALRA